MTFVFLETNDSKKYAFSPKHKMLWILTIIDFLKIMYNSQNHSEHSDADAILLWKGSGTWCYNPITGINKETSVILHQIPREKAYIDSIE